MATAPPTPTGYFANTGSTDTDIFVSFNGDGGSPITDVGVYVHRVSNDALVWSDGSVSTATRYDVTGLKRYTEYYAKIKVWNAIGGSGYYTTNTQRTKAELIELWPSSKAATNVARTSFVAPKPAIYDNGGQAPYRHRVFVNTSPSMTGAVEHLVTSWADVTVNGLNPLTTYYYCSEAYNSAGWSDPNDWGSVTTLDAVPTDPAAPAISTISETSAYVSWAAPALNGATLDNYLVRVCTGNDPNAYVKTYTLPSSVTGVSVSGLTKGTWYNVFVKAQATPTDSGWSPATAFKTAGSWSTLRPWIKSGGVWYRALVWKNDGGTWKRVYTGLKVGGTWRRELD